MLPGHHDCFGQTTAIWFLVIKGLLFFMLTITHQFNIIRNLSKVYGVLQRTQKGEKIGLMGHKRVLGELTRSLASFG